MSTRLQVVMDEQEMQEIRRIARQNQMTVAEWVRQVLRTARREQPVRTADLKLSVVRAAVRHTDTGPAPEIEQMVAEISQGYLTEEPE